MFSFSIHQGLQELLLNAFHSMNKTIDRIEIPLKETFTENENDIPDPYVDINMEREEEQNKAIVP